MTTHEHDDCRGDEWWYERTRRAWAEAGLPGPKGPTAVMLFGVRWIGLAITTVVAVTTFTTSPAPGVSGSRLGVLLALVVFVATALAAYGTANGLLARTRRTVVGTLGLWTASALALLALQPDGLAWLGFFAALGATAMNVPARVGAALWGATLVGVAVVMALAGAPPSTIATTEIGMFVFVALCVFIIRLRWLSVRQRDLIAELEASREAQAQAAALEERGRLAREMHDVLAHSLSALVVQLEGARLLAARSGSSPEVSEAVSRAHHLAQSGLDEARRAIGALRGDDLPGPELLASLVEEFEHATGMAASLEVAGEPNGLASEAGLALYRTAQEALTNIRKHTHADRVEVELRYGPDAARLVVQDFGTNGRTNGARVTGMGYGLTGMRERAELLGGRLAAAPTRDGFRVELSLPS